MQFPHLSVTKLALGNLKTRKKQYILLILGIVLSIAFSASVLFFSAAQNASMEQRRKERVGNQKFIVYDAEHTDLSVFYEADPTVEFIEASVLGYGYTDPENRLQGMNIAVGNDAWRGISGQELLSGRMPTAENEIAVEKNALTKMMLTAEIGEKITLLVDIPDGEGGVLRTEEVTYTLVGILEDKRKGIREDSFDVTFDMYRDAPAAFLCDTAVVSPGGKAIKLLYGTCEMGGDALYLHLHRQEYEKVPTMTMHDRWYTSEDSAGSIFYSMLTFFGFMLVLGSCFGIVGAFNMNLQERKRQIGLLRAVGATRTQIVNVFGREACLIALCTVPVGLALSYFVSQFLIHKIDSTLEFTPPWYTFVLGALAGFAVVMVAALVPLFSAARISPMQAIRNTDVGVKMKRRKIKPKAAYKVPQLLASRELKLHGFKNSGVAVFLAIGVLMAALGPAFAEVTFTGESYIEQDFSLITSFSRRMAYVNSLQSNLAYSDNDVLRVLSHPDVKSVDVQKESSVVVDVGKMTAYIMESGGSNVYEFENYEKSFANYHLYDPENMVVSEDMKPFLEKTGLSENIFTATLLVLEDRAVKRLIENSEGSPDFDAIQSGKQMLLRANSGFAIYGHGSSGYTMKSIDADNTPESLKKADAVLYQDALFAGDTVKMSWLVAGEEMDAYENELAAFDGTQKDFEIEIGGIVRDLLSIRDIHSEAEAWGLSFITTESGMRALGIEAGITAMDISLVDPTDEQAQADVKAHLEDVAQRVENYYISSDYESRMEDLAARRQFYLGLAALLCLFFVITAATLCNATNAKVRESRRIIGTLRAVGADRAALRQIYFRQYAAIFGIGIITGYGVTALVKLGMDIYSKILDTEPLFTEFILWPSVVFIAAVVSVCLINLVVRLHRETRRSIVENIREL